MIVIMIMITVTITSGMITITITIMIKIMIMIMIINKSNIYRGYHQANTYLKLEWSYIWILQFTMLNKKLKLKNVNLRIRK